MGHMSHKGMPQRALPAPGGKMKIKKKIKVYDTHYFSIEKDGSRGKDV